MIRNVVAAAVLAVMPASLQASEAMPLDLAFSRHQIVNGERNALSADGRWFAYEVRTPLVKSPEAAGETEPRFLPNGMPAVLIGIHLFVADVKSGESRAVCEAPASCWRASWSPDNRRLAYYSDAGGEIGVWLYDAAAHQSHRLGTARIKAKLWPGDVARWSPDGKRLYVLLPPPSSAAAARPRSASAGADAAPAAVTVYRTAATPSAARSGASDDVDALNKYFLNENDSAIATIDVATGATTVIVPSDRHPNVMRLSPDGRWIAYLTVFRSKSAEETHAYEDLVVVPSSGGKAIVTIRDLVLGEDGYAGRNVRWSPDSRHIVYIRDRDLWIVDAAENAQPRRLAQPAGSIVTPLLLTADGNAAVAAIEGKEPQAFDVGAPRGVVVAPLDMSAPRVLDVAGTPIAASEDVALQQAAGTIDVIRDAASVGEREVVRVDIASGKTTRVWTARARLDVAGAAADGSAIVARYENVTTPPGFYLFSRGFERVRRLGAIEPRLDSVKVGDAESFTTAVPKHDGGFLEVGTHVSLPPGAKAGDALPTVVYFYSGMPFTMYSRDFGGGAPGAIPVAIFTTRGYAVLFCDVPLGPEGKAGNPMQEMTDVILAQVYRAAALGYTDIKRVAIMGHSYGAYSTAAIITHTQLFRAALALDGVYDLASSYAWMDPGGTNNFMWAESGQGRMGSDPWSDVQRYIDNSPFYQAGKIHTPLLLIHGEKDGACPVSEARKMFSALKRLGRECELATYAGEGHVTGRWALANAVDAGQRMLEFLAEHVK